MTSNGWFTLVIPAVAEEDVSYQIGPRGSDIYHRQAGELLLPERETQEDLDRIRRELGSVNYSAQYQQQPVPPGGNIIERVWIRYFDQEPKRFDRKIVSWDAASTIQAHSSYSVGTVWGLLGISFYLLTVHRGRWDFPELQRRIVKVHREENADLTVIEDEGVGRAAAQSLREAGELAPQLRRPRLEKEARLLKHAAKFEGGQILIRGQARWQGPYLQELIAFPNSRHKDQVDSTTQALTELSRFRRRHSVAVANENYGPTGRRTRASLTQSRQPRGHEHDVEDVLLEGGPNVRKVAADWEPEAVQTRPSRQR